MQTEIPYSGLTTVPSDYAAADGQAAFALDLLSEDGALHPIFQPADGDADGLLLTLPSGLRVVYVHETTDYTHYILYKDATNEVYWTAGDTETNSTLAKVTLLQAFDDDVTVNKPITIGNTLILLTSEGMHYYLWKGEDTGYLYLGDKIPELPIAFGLKREFKRKTASTASEESIMYFETTLDSSHYTASTINTSGITALMAIVNKFVSELATGEGRFCLPFFVRYALRLYDGSTLVKHSAPILMVATSGANPLLIAVPDGRYYYHFYACGCISSLQYAVVDEEALDTLKTKWKDIVSSVDIFISSPIYTYDQSLVEYQINRATTTGADAPYTIYGKASEDESDRTFGDVEENDTIKSADHFKRQLLDVVSHENNADSINWLLRPDKDIIEDIKAVGSFFLLKSFKLTELKTSMTTIEVENDYLQSLVNREAMTDDYRSHDQLTAKRGYELNNRINLVGMGRILFQGFTPNEMVHFTTPQVTTCKCYIFIREDNREVIVESKACALYSKALSPILYVYYPNANAYKAAFVITEDGTTTNYEVPLTAHDFLNGAYFFEDWTGVVQDKYKVDGKAYATSSVKERTFSLPNKLYTSEVNNPFYFPATGINTVGTGTIIGITSAVKALSQGQFGQFPLYAFTTDGVWALEVSSDGTYSAKQPVTRDVCINADSITQLDSTVLFATDRGIMLIEGSQTACFTEALTGYDLLSVEQLPKFKTLLALAGFDTAALYDASGAALRFADFPTFLRTAQMIYDYPHQRIVLYCPDCAVAYVFSLKSKQWGLMRNVVAYSLNAYPEALAVTRDGQLVNFAFEADADKQQCGLYITRPLKFDAPNVLKTLRAVVQRGYFREGDVKTVVYGSRDLRHWFIVYSSTTHKVSGISGTPYKYFRIAALTRFTKADSLQGASVEYVAKQTNKLR